MAETLIARVRHGTQLDRNVGEEGGRGNELQGRADRLVDRVLERQQPDEGDRCRQRRPRADEGVPASLGDARHLRPRVHVECLSVDSVLHHHESDSQVSSFY